MKGDVRRHLLDLRQALDGIIHALLEHHDLLIFLVPESFQIAFCIVHLREQVVDLDLFGLKQDSVWCRKK